MDLEEEGYDAGFIGIIMKHDGDTGLIEPNQTGLTDIIIEYLGLDVGTTKVKCSPTEATPLFRKNYV